MSDHTLHLHFEGLARPVELADTGDLLPYFDKAFRGWRYSVSNGPAEDAVLRLHQEAGKYRLEAAWIEQAISRSDKVDTLCAFIAEFIRAYVTQDDQLLCLHGAAAEIGGRLVVFPNRYRAGKSVLSACLAASGVRLFADDVLPIGGEEDLGIAPGFVPRLRLPLPDDMSAAMRSGILRRAGIHGKRYLYLDLDPEELAARDTSAPIGAFVLLDREPGAEPDLSPVPESEVLRQVIWQNFAREAPASAILGRLHRLVAGASCLRLRYGRAEDAVPLLRRAFAEWPETATEEDRAPCQTVDGSPGRAVDSLEGCFFRKPGVEDRMMDGERFLADSQGTAIYHLNPVASAVWHLLAEPKTVEQLIDLIHGAFPDVDRDRIARDVGALTHDLANKRLLLSLP